MDECFFNSLVVGVPCSLIFWQFWLFIVLKWDVILHLDVQGSEAFLRMPPSWPAKSLIPFEFILVYGVIWWSSFIFLHVLVQFSQHHLLKRLSLAHCMFLPPLLNIK